MNSNNPIQKQPYWSSNSQWGCLFYQNIILHQESTQQVLLFLDKYMKRSGKDKQPINHPSAGSVFKRPEGAFAAALIEECGLKGCAVGGAEVSEKHAGFIINDHNASAEDVLSLIAHIKKVVKEKKNVDLTCEVKFIGRK